MKAAMLLALAALSISTAHAAEPTGTLTLACQGTTDLGGSENEPSSMGLVVDFTTRTVTGFRFRGYLVDDIPVAITGIGEQVVTFKGSKKHEGYDNPHAITGIIDRVNGDVYWTWTPGETTRTFSLQCKPTQRMF